VNDRDHCSEYGRLSSYPGTGREMTTTTIMMRTDRTMLKKKIKKRRITAKLVRMKKKMFLL
jgi:hypothetical protein